MSQPAQQQPPPGTQPAELALVPVLLGSDGASYIAGAGVAITRGRPIL